MFHRFNHKISKQELPGQFTCPFFYVPHPLVVEAAGVVQEYLLSRPDWADEIGQGKMFGVLVVVDDNGAVGFLAAYSGNIANRNDYPFFVPPVYDLLCPDGFFRKGESEISAMNEKIRCLEQSDEYLDLQRRLVEARAEAVSAVDAFKLKMKDSKKRRDAMRASGIQTDAMIRESQFEKAELKRIKRHCGECCAEMEHRVREFTLRVDALKEERKRRSMALQRKLFDCFVVYNARGEKAALTDIFESARHELPPAGTGECCAPKLLQYAYQKGYKPLAMGEFWWGKSPVGEVRRHLQFYPACKSKCEPVLDFMLQGLDVESNPLKNAEYKRLEIIYEDEWLLVVDKPEGMLSVPGKIGADSVYDVLQRRFPDIECMFVVHRLDMHTSGLLLVAKSKDVYKSLQRQFAERTVEKEYEAIVEGDAGFPEEGTVSLPMCLDPDNRPMQIVSREFGKEAVSDYRVVCRYPDGSARVRFFPHTGRTHQLRVHASHPFGLDAPIRGDMLYGKPSERLFLHACRLSFTHPVTGCRITFTSPVPF